MLPIALNGQVGVITGAGSAYGIGRSMVLAAAAAGAKAIYACDLNLGNMDALKKDIKDSGSDSILEPRFLDVSDEGQTEALVKEIVKTHGRLDFFFANAGYAVYRSLESTDPEVFRRAFAVMQLGPFLALKHGAKGMSVTSAEKPEAKGSIVITSSCAAFAGAYADAVYTSVKKACNGLVESGSVQLAASNIRVNGIAPGATKSSILTSSRLAEGGGEYKDAATQEEMRATHDKFFARGGLFDQKEKLYNRMAEPEEIAHLACFLASDLAAAVNGHVVLADSGKLAAATGEGFTGPVTPVKPLEL